MSKEKTAIDTAIELVEDLFSDDLSGTGILYRMQVCKILENLKPMQRQQIYEAFVAGDERGTGEIPFNCEQYFQQKYGDEK